MSTSNLFFDTFRRTVRIQGVLKCETALRIGAGKSFDGLTSDLPILRDARSRPILPGASLKGVIRSQVEAVLRSIDTANACDPLGPKPCIRAEESRKDQAQKTDKRRTSSAERSAAQRTEIQQKVCWACGIFGAPGLASHVLFADAVALMDIDVERRDGVAIDRDLARAANGKKFDYEVVPAGSTFRLHITMQDLDDAGEGALLIGLDLLNEGIARVGGFKSRGLGLVSLQNMSVFVRTKDNLAGFSQDYAAFKAERLHALHTQLEQGNANA